MDLKKTEWLNTDYHHLIELLKSEADEKYRDFQKGLILGDEKMIGIRMPRLRQLGKEISKGNWKAFISLGGADYIEEKLLKAIVAGLSITDIREFITTAEDFIPLIGNWAVCDAFCSGAKIVRKHQEEFWPVIEKWLRSDNPWAVRAGIVMIISHYMTEDYLIIALNLCERIQSDNYYVRTAQAWLVSEAYARFPVKTHDYLTRSLLDDWTFNKALQKARESFRVSDERKYILLSMKR